VPAVPEPATSNGVIAGAALPGLRGLGQLGELFLGHKIRSGMSGQRLGVGPTSWHRGTLDNSTRSCSGARSTPMHSQRAAPPANTDCGRPAGFALPSSTE